MTRASIALAQFAGFVLVIVGLGVLLSPWVALVILGVLLVLVASGVERANLER